MRQHLSQGILAVSVVNSTGRKACDFNIAGHGSILYLLFIHVKARGGRGAVWG